MRDFSISECDGCGTGHAPSCFFPTLEETPSGRDVFGHFRCHECGQESMVAFERRSFEFWLEQEMGARVRESMQERINEVHRYKSALGREVADFRNKLKRVETVEDIGEWK